MKTALFSVPVQVHSSVKKINQQNTVCCHSRLIPRCKTNVSVLSVSGEDKERVPVRGVLLPEQEAGGQAEETGGRDQRSRGAAKMCKNVLQGEKNKRFMHDAQFL